MPPAIDLARNQLYVGTGNNYTVPSSVYACQKANPTSSTCTEPTITSTRRWRST